jgi:ATP-binding cassette subfamily B protein
VLKLDEEDEVPNGVEPPLGGDIVFENVRFGYDDTTHVFDGLNMTIKGGTTAAILGGTGSGKSSLIQLLQRLYDLQGGRITIGGEDITKIKKSWLRGKISIVLQEPFLYSKTILRNIGIKLEVPDAETVMEAAKIAAVHDDIESFELGYETIVGERGVTLSGGQQQRVAIARSLVNDSAVLIFDDSLSAVDTHTDAMIRSALNARRKDVTTIIISHRIATLKEAGRIYVLKDGKVAEEGTHDELMAFGGIYCRTCDIQSAQAD